MFLNSPSSLMSLILKTIGLFSNDEFKLSKPIYYVSEALKYKIYNLV